jgi:hypothetical protein
MDDWLALARVQRVRLGRVGEKATLLLQLRVPGKTILVVLAGGLGAGVLDAGGHERVREAMAGGVAPAQAQWRAQLEGARVEGIGAREVRLSRDGKRWRTVAKRGTGELELLREESQPERAEGDGSGGSAGPLPHLGEQALFEAGARIAEQLAHGVGEGHAEALRRALAKAIARVRRRRDAVRSDLERAREAESTARGAELFVAEAARAPRGATRLVAIDWSDGAPREAVFPLDPARSAREQLDALFRKARRMKDGARIAAQRLGDAENALAALTAISDSLAAGDVDLPALEARARAAAPRDFSFSSSSSSTPGPKRRSATQPSLPYRTYLSTSGTRILVGRGAEKNDALTFHVARPHDLWLHAKGRAGAHVVVPLEKGASCPPEVLVEAAHLAAHFSEAKGEALVEVQHTPRRYLRKPKGSAPGFVVVDREKVLVLRRQEALERKLLEREVTAG